MNLLFLFFLVNFLPSGENPAGMLYTVDSVGACQGITSINGKIYLYGDRETGVIREYQSKGDSLFYNNKELRLTLYNRDLISHPTGLAFYNSTAFIGNSTRKRENPDKWNAFIFYIDWNKLLSEKTLDNCLISIIEDDVAIQGTRPEYIECDGKEYIATADYGGVNNEVRLYNPEKLKEASRTSEPGVLVARFSCGPWIQNLHWIKDKNILVLVQNKTEGKKWRLTFLDFRASVISGKEKVIRTIDFENLDELEGFYLFNCNMGIATSSSKTDNVFIFDLSL